MKLAATHTDADNSPPRAGLTLGTNQSGMRAFNERLVLSLIRQSGALPKARIAQMTGLSAQTVSVIMRALEADGLLVKGTPERGKIGQPSVPMSLHRDGAFFLGIQIGRRSLELVLTDFLGQAKQRVRIDHSHPTPDSVVQFANDAIAEALGHLPSAHQSRVAGLGLALPFQLWDWPTLPGADPSEMEQWRTRDVAAEISDQWDFPVFHCNDASAACCAELVFGDQDKPRDFLYFFVGYFVGGGLVLDDALYTGRTGNAAALGSLPVICEGRGVVQLVDIASLAALNAKLQAGGCDGAEIWKSPEKWAIPNGILDAWLDDAANGIAQAIMASVCLIDLDTVLIEGWMPPQIRADLVQRTRLRIRELPLAGVQTPSIREGTIGSNARSLGAASLPLSERFLVNRNTFLKG